MIGPMKSLNELVALGPESWALASSFVTRSSFPLLILILLIMLTRDKFASPSSEIGIESSR